ncbi:MAG: glycosyltransferase family 9 protein [Ginsengibacter sp.]
MKFLITRFSSPGDIVLTTPVIRCLRKKYPDSVIHFLTSSEFGFVLNSNPYIDEVIYLQSDFKQTLEEIKSHQYDHIIDLHRELYTRDVRKYLNNPVFHFLSKQSIRRRNLFFAHLSRKPQKHLVDQYMEKLSVLGVENDGWGLDYFIDEKDKVKSEDIPLSHSHGFVAISIGASHFTKRLPVNKLIELVSKINFPIIIVGDKDYTDIGETIAAVDPIKIYNACGKFSLNETADIIQRSTLVISNDSFHIPVASAFRKNVFSVWGNTVPTFGNIPYQSPHEIFEINKLWCRPCSSKGFIACPLGHFKCMNKQDMQSIASSLHSFVKK